MDDQGYETLIDTTRSPKAAKQLAQKALTEGAVEVIIYKETNEELDQQFRLKKLSVFGKS